ncbi:hypothetical protein C7S20_10215 [Christiangramia fulva]|uniref:FAS1 domain-containing protein n=1 Tax=Christiangramia fulva TaxID=2126553 RepID=A0A2R3Z5Q3_9FLAO|nr:fasciclin domain-containing protein [Christiangramia fulva]AVR45607.1 hypothetical protein C7S20_10215 [Christiangramia fulva]
MNFIKKFWGFLGVVTIVGSLNSCTDNFDDHTAVNDLKLQNTLEQNIATNGDLSDFHDLLVETGYDKVLSSSETFTVWVPTNQAMQAVSNEALATAAMKTEFVKNHISLNRVPTSNIEDTLSIQMLTGKYQNFYADNHIEEASVVEGDQYASNGVYHVIDMALIPNPNLWEFIKSNTGYKQNDFVTTLDNYDLFQNETDLREAIDTTMQVDNDSIYNELLRTGYYFKNEKKNYTYFLMQDEGFTAETDKMLPYSQKPTQDSTEHLAKYYVVRDMVFENKYYPSNLPDTLISQAGVKVPVNEENIVGQPITLSNGIAYVMKRVDVPIENKLLPVKIQGEMPIGFSQDDKSANIFYRDKADPSGNEFQDIEVRNHGVPRFSIYYNAKNLYSTTYRVYWRAINDFEGSFWQHIRIGGHFEVDEFGNQYVADPIVEYDSKEIPPYDYNEEYVGEFTLEYAGDLELISLIAENTGSNRWNPLTLDYIKLVPVVE